MIFAGLLLLLGLSPLQAAAAEVPQAQSSSGETVGQLDEPLDPALTANTDEPSGVLRFSIRGTNGRLMPGRLTFVRKAGEILDLFPGVDARPDNLAVRRNVVYCLSGEDAITVPVGEYTAYATRGIEYSQAMQVVRIEAGQELEWHPVLKHDVSTGGWISGDFHLHTLTHSGHGDSNMKERVISLIGEGVEFAVATDHNHNTDYEPTMKELGAEDEMKAVVGNEVSTPIGHINAFPLDATSEVIDAGLTDAAKLFKLIREQTNPHGVKPVIQLNHPRWSGIDYFTIMGLDPITGLSDHPNWSANFDTIELLNENEGWGYHDADTAGELYVGSGMHSVLQDWYNLLNLGQRYFAVGNSDSHTVHHAFAGYPRNFVRSSTDNPSRIDPAEIARALKAGRSFTSLGPFMDFRVNGQESGEIVRVTEHNIAVTVKLQAPSWIFLDRVKVILNGDLYKTIDVEPFVLEDGSIRWPTARAVVQVHRDSWVHVIVEGDHSLDPIVAGKRPVLPLAISNPIWIQTDNDGAQTSTWTWAISESATRKTLDGLRPNDAAMVLQAGAKQRSPTMPSLVRSGLGYDDRLVQLAAMRAIESLQMPGLETPLQALFANPSDAYQALTVCRALNETGAGGSADRLVDLFDRYGGATLGRYRSDLDRLHEGDPVRDWLVVGHFASESTDDLFEKSFGPESAFDAEASFEGKSGPVGWKAQQASASGYLDLSAISPATAESSISFAQTWLEAPEAMSAIYALGSDDGCRFWLNGEEIYRDKTQHGAKPLQQVGRVNLKAGWNRVLIGVQNGGGSSGLHFSVLSSDVGNSPQPN